MKASMMFLIFLSITFFAKAQRYSCHIEPYCTIELLYDSTLSTSALKLTNHCHCNIYVFEKLITIDSLAGDNHHIFIDYSKDFSDPLLFPKVVEKIWLVKPEESVIKYVQAPRLEKLEKLTVDISLISDKYNLSKKLKRKLKKCSKKKFTYITWKDIGKYMDSCPVSFRCNLEIHTAHFPKY